MNYLAHAYLSFDDAGVLTGNIISDFVKGRRQYEFPDSIQKGIRLHRAIDAFTDAHPATQNIKELFRTPYRLYAGAFADIVYDYFLANDQLRFESDQARLNFTQRVFEQLREKEQYFPEKFAGMFPYMQSQNWLYNYAYDWGIEKSFIGLSRRAQYIPETETAFGIFLENKNYMDAQYARFFPELLQFATDTLSAAAET